jgi:hypothetical protein
MTSSAITFELYDVTILLIRIIIVMWLKSNSIDELIPDLNLVKIITSFQLSKVHYEL